MYTLTAPTMTNGGGAPHHRSKSGKKAGTKFIKKPKKQTAKRKLQKA